MPLVAGVDSSTQSTKIEIRDADTGALVASGQAPHPSVTPPCSEQDPHAWWTAFNAAWARASNEANAASNNAAVTAISVAGQQHGLVALDDRREVIRPAKLWNDTEAAPDAEWLIGQLPGGRSAWADACGSVPVAAFTIAKLSWLHRKEPDAWSQLNTVCLPHDWLTMRLCGELISDRGDASGTGYWSPSEGRYREDLLAIVDDTLEWSKMLPEVLGPNDRAGSWGTTMVGPGTGDNMAAALGLGAHPGDVVFSLGTSGTVYTVSDNPVADGSGAVAGFADATGRFLPLVCTLNATRVTDTVAGLLGVDHRGLDELAAQAAPDAGGLTLIPHFDGERTPDRPTATGTLRGIRTSTSRADMARAAFNGVLCGLLDGLEALDAHAATDGRILLVGGGARSSATRHALADLTGRAVVVPDLAEPVATGACVQAAAVLHGEASEAVRSAWSIGAAVVTEPDDRVDSAAIRAAYATARDAQ